MSRNARLMLLMFVLGTACQKENVPPSRPTVHETPTLLPSESSPDTSFDEVSVHDDSNEVRPIVFFRVMIVGNEWDDAMDQPGHLEINFQSIPVYRSSHTIRCPTADLRGRVQLEGAAWFPCSGGYFDFAQSDSETHSEQVFAWLRHVIEAEHEESLRVTIKNQSGGVSVFEFQYHIRQPGQVHLNARPLGH